MIPHVEPPRFRRWPLSILDKYRDQKRHQEYIEKHGFLVKDWSMATSAEIKASFDVATALLNQITHTADNRMLSIDNLHWLHPMHAQPLIDALNARKGNKQFIPGVTKIVRNNAALRFLEHPEL